nr:TPA: orf y [Tanacetum cinerariifolium]
DNWDIISADFDDSSVYIISEGEGDVHQNINIMVQDTPIEEAAFMEIEESDDEQDIEEEKTEQVQQMISDQAKEYYESKIDIKEKEELWQTKRTLLVRDLTDALKIIDQLKAKQMRLRAEKDEEIRTLKAQLLNSRQQATHKIKQGHFLIEGNKFKIPLIYALDMRDSNGSKAFLEQFKPIIDRLKHQGYIGEEPLKHWKKNGKLCKLDIINPYITIEDRPLKHVTPAMEDSFKKHVVSLLIIGAIRPSKSRHRTMAMIVNSGTTIDPVTGKEVKGKERMVFNYKSLNDNTCKDQYSLPGINTIIKRIGGAKIFSKFDLKLGFHQVAMDEESIPWTAFLHAKHLEKMLKICEDNGLVLSPTKMKIAVSTIDFLGVVIGEETIKLQPHIIKKIVNFNEEELKTKKGLRWMHGRMGRNSQMEKEQGRSKRMHRRNAGISNSSSLLSGESSTVP